MNKSIILSIAIIAISAVAVVGVTTAFFSDTETSTGNTFTAGAIDLKIDNHAWFNGEECTGDCPFTWELSNLDGKVFFDYQDIKPGDWEEDTVSIHVNNNNAWVCAATKVTQDNDVDYSEPEKDDDSTVNENDPQNTDGELDENLYIAVWADDGDNVYEEGENLFLEGYLHDLVNDKGEGKVTLADSSQNVWSGTGPIEGGSTFYIGKFICFGNAQPTPVAPGDKNNPSNDPGFTCDGKTVNNASQTDILEGALQFYAVQSRNNSDFSCQDDWVPSW